jgi:hypothetical protein
MYLRKGDFQIKRPGGEFAKDIWPNKRRVGNMGSVRSVRSVGSAKIYESELAK